VTHGLSLPFVHVCVPHAHVFGGSSLVHWQPSFGMPLQLASLPRVEQASAVAGSTCPTHVVPQVVLALSADKMHVRVPDLHDPVLLPGHGPVEPAGHTHVVVSWLSGRPLQSLSSVDVQSRAFAATAPVQIVGQVALTQICVPGLQIPIAEGPHDRVVPLTQVQPSWGTPLQLSSLVGSQPSADAGPTEPTHAPQALDFLSAATAQVCAPALHGPLPSWAGCWPQACVAPDVQAQTASIVLSGCPSQSLSSVEVQSRAAGSTAPTQVPQAPPAQVCEPFLQIPTAAAGPQA
jgi:hypothetical protein